jgi:hypothetical protein
LQLTSDPAFQCIKQVTGSGWVGAQPDEALMLKKGRKYRCLARCENSPSGGGENAADMPQANRLTVGIMHQ